MSGQPPQYRAGIVGLGFIGAGDDESGEAIGGQKVANLDGTHSAALTNCPRVDLVAGSTRNAGRRDRFANRFPSCTTYSDYAAMLANESLDIVSVATYAKVHAPITIAAAEAGAKAVYCEKPIATTSTDGQAMIDACKANGCLLVLNHNRRFNPNYLMLRDRIAAGDVGKLASINIQWSGGRLGNVATHHIDAACMLAGERIARVSAILDESGKPDCRGDDLHDPGGWGMFQFESGLVMTLDAAEYTTAPLSLNINGSNGRALTGRYEVTLEFPDRPAEHWPSAVDDVSSMDRAVQQIVAHLDGSAPFPYPAEESLHVMQAIIAMHVSHQQNGAWAALPLNDALASVEVLSG